MFIALGILLVLLLGIPLFVRLYPAFGGRTSAARRARYAQSPQWQGKKFAYTEPTSSFHPSSGNMVSLLRDYLRGNPRVRPDRTLPVVKLGRELLENRDRDWVAWLGHSALLLHLGGKRLLLDPMLGPSPTPLPPFGGKRYTRQLPVEPEDLPEIDAVILSHDHYDHLDYGTIRKLKDKVGRFFVPLGVGSHLQRWGVEPERISEHDWGEEIDWNGLRLACTPARHFSGRGLANRDGTLWCSWVIASPERKVFFSGDSGYGPHFKQIGEKYGPFDLALMECGQYDPRWSDIHMLPEQTVQAHADVNGGLLLPIHWGAFTLSLHDWNDPVRRATAEAERQGVPIATPKIGEPVFIGDPAYPKTAWWV
ncbi:MBL fold metallo-hydrolase [uncultured Paenibacillus sp.]|uniref:MBL fold metallo-hydrolase n=1 Tax=uncultured Paenibacillus sp. TaxID=227322 RepID=UPI0015AD9390|nr:MBL fold metallo-hydrolase [uncultured Paenibacillus sp.]